MFNLGQLFSGGQTMAANPNIASTVPMPANTGTNLSFMDQLSTFAKSPMMPYVLGQLGAAFGQPGSAGRQVGQVAAGMAQNTMIADALNKMYGQGGAGAGGNSNFQLALLPPLPF